MRFARVVISSARVSWHLIAATLLTPCVTTTAAAQSTARTPVIELRDAQWFDGRAFVRGSRWMQQQQFVTRPAGGADSVIDLRGAWMVPPYADAHTHGPDGPWGFDGIRDMFLRLGVYYVQVLGNTRSGRIATRAQVNIPTSVDAVFADAPVTATGGHPQVLYESLGLFRRFSQTDAERYAAARSLARDGDVYVRLDSLLQLAPIVERMSRDTVAVLKVMLLESESWGTRHRDSTQVGSFGMNPALLPPLVAAAHARGRRVWAHVETPYDLEIALRAGVDGFAHVPSYGVATGTDSAARSRLIPDSTVRLAGSRRVPMTATLGIGLRGSATDSASLRRFTSITVRNAAALRRAGVILLAGSDTYSNADVVRGDPAATAQLLNLTPLEYLRMWSVDTPLAIFPGRRIAQFRPSYDASALALECNPLRDTACLSRISRRLKQGVWLSSTAEPAEAQR